MRPFPVLPPTDCRVVLPSADFCDAFAIDVPDPALDAPEAARRAFARQPRWITVLLALRNAVVSPLGLKTGADHNLPKQQRFGIFPILSSSPQRVVLGFDDRHLDFRIVIDVVARGDSLRRAIATTLVRRHNVFGRAYLAAVLPFHKVIVPATLSRLCDGSIRPMDPGAVSGGKA